MKRKASKPQDLAGINVPNELLTIIFEFLRWHPTYNCVHSTWKCNSNDYILHLLSKTQDFNQFAHLETLIVILNNEIDFCIRHHYKLQTVILKQMNSNACVYFGNLVNLQTVKVNHANLKILHVQNCPKFDCFELRNSCIFDFITDNKNTIRSFTFQDSLIPNGHDDFLDLDLDYLESNCPLVLTNQKCKTIKTDKIMYGKFLAEELHTSSFDIFTSQSYAIHQTTCYY